MITIVLAGALAIAAVQEQQIDTTFDVRSGGRLTVEAMNGSTMIDTWDRSAVRVRAEYESTSGIEIRVRSEGVSIVGMSHVGAGPRRGAREGARQGVAFRITVPRSFSVEVEGMNMPITLDGVGGSVSIDNLEGGIIVRGVTGNVSAETVSGSVTVENVRGNVSASSVNQAIRLNGVHGDVSVEAVNGSILLHSIDSRRVDVSAVNGLIEYNGTIYDDGRYRLSTHNGRITMAVPENANARLTVETRNGKVETAFPVRVQETDSREFTIMIGKGSARIQLESHNGTVYLVRPSGR